MRWPDDEESAFLVVFVVAAIAMTAIMFLEMG